MDSTEFSNGSVPPALQPLADKLSRYRRQYKGMLDRTTPHTLNRWLGFGGVAALFLLRILVAQGWYIICYGWAIYLLNLLLAFLQPKFDPSLEADLAADEVEEGGPDTQPVLPSATDDEFRPFIRRLPEWDFWLSSTRATIIALFLTFTSATDIPVYWPILLVYFFVLFALTMRRQIQHMVKYKYVPWDFGKTKYGRK
ncbi:retrieval of early ER protein Rer1 [Sistotremastrum niveocremeum HHB9708]|uniref:Protein RER1 n=2 Tax=Sistotremastraceae TaxID=3402574 RepID=A0A164P1I3_9AGAM|nr:retrieval of early ER protein Rer1 [Sistotremastrum niveocremeum HHB9708]KZT39309.1 retrieval of early ER protein Rer1 [Sistotremastrum suecicum HHB10207 ss-3]